MKMMMAIMMIVTDVIVLSGSKTFQIISHSGSLSYDFLKSESVGIIIDHNSEIEDSLKHCFISSQETSINIVQANKTATQKVRKSGNILLTYLKAFFVRHSSEYENVG